MIYSYIIQSQNSTISCQFGNQRLTYKLVGVMVHKSLYKGCGHYVTFMRSSLTNTHWIYMDDAEVYSGSIYNASTVEIKTCALHRWLRLALLQCFNKNLFNCSMSFRKVWLHRICTTSLKLFKSTESTMPTPLSLNVCCPIVGQTYLTDQVYKVHIHVHTNYEHHNLSLHWIGYIPVCKIGCIRDCQGTHSYGYQ